jgi:hypothetical protein
VCVCELTKPRPLCGSRGAHRRSLGFARDDKGEGGEFLLGAVRSDGQKETAGLTSTAFSRDPLADISCAILQIRASLDR